MLIIFFYIISFVYSKIIQYLCSAIPIRVTHLDMKYEESSHPRGESSKETLDNYEKQLDPS